MGNKSSNIEAQDTTPFDILEIEPGCSKEEIRKAYLSMLLKYHPTRNKDSSDQKVMEIKDAYEALISGDYKPKCRLDLSLYTEHYFIARREQFYDTVDNFIKKLLIEEPEANYPNFKSINHKKFYDFFSKFKTQRFFTKDKVINKELQKEFNDKVKVIIDIIKKYDARTIKEVKKTEKINIQKEAKIKAKKERITNFNCNECQKGFKNVKQYINHLSSKKHCTKVNWTEEIKETEIKKIISSLNLTKEENLEEKETEIDKEVKRNERLLEELYIGMNKKGNLEENIEDKPRTRKKTKKPAEKLEEETIESEFNNDQLNEEEIKNKKREKKLRNKAKEIEKLTKCTLCKLSFHSRNRLFLHLNDEHYKSKKSK